MSTLCRRSSYFLVFPTQITDYGEDYFTTPLYNIKYSFSPFTQSSQFSHKIQSPISIFKLVKSKSKNNIFTLIHKTTIQAQWRENTLAYYYPYWIIDYHKEGLKEH